MPAPVPDQINLLLSPEDGTSRSSAEYAPRITALAGGGFVALWKDFLSTAADPDGGGTMMVKRFGADGLSLGPAMPVSATVNGDMDGAGLVTLGNGNVVAAWGALDIPGSTSRIGALVIDPATGAVIGSEVAVASSSSVYGGEGLNFHQIVALSGNRAGVIYIDGGGTGAVSDSLKLRIIEADGTAGAVSTLLTQGGPWLPAIGVHDAAVALLGPNADVIALAAQTFSGFNVNSQIVFRNLDGTVAWPTLHLANPDGYIPVLAARPDGGLVVAHSLPQAAASTAAIRVYRVGADGAVEGTTDIAFPYSSFGTTELAVLPDGGFLVAISGFGAVGFDPNIYAQRVNADGSLEGGVVRLDATTQGQQTRPEMAMAGNGTLVVAWEDTNNGFDYQIRGARFDLAEPGILQSGTGAAETLAGGAGADTLFGRGGDDTITGGAGNDVLNGMLGADSLSGGEGDDTLGAGAGVGANTLDGGAGADLLASGIDGDLLLGGDGADTLFGNDGADTLDGGASADRLRGDAGDDRAAGGEGGDTVSGGAGADTLSGDAGADSLRGDADGDLLLGGDGNDQLFGDSGLDTLIGGAGADTLRGGEGNDVIRYTGLAESGPLAADLLFDFQRGNDDLDLSAIDADASTIEDDAFAFIGSAAFTGGLGVAEVRQVRDLGLRQLRIEIDSADADADADMVIIMRGLTLLDTGDLVL